MVTSGPVSSPLTYTYNADNELISGGGVTYSYDAAGRRIGQVLTPPGGSPQSVALHLGCTRTG